MSRSVPFLSPSEAAERLGVSAKALRLYEQRGLLTPVRSAAGWRAYGAAEMERAEEIVTWRALGLSLAQIARVLTGDGKDLEPALDSHQATLENRIRDLIATLAKMRNLRSGLSQGNVPKAGELSRLMQPTAAHSVAFDLPWPWGGERFELRDVRALNYIIGPLGSGKLRLAQRLVETLPGAVFVGLERSTDGGEVARRRLDTDPSLKLRVGQAMTWLVEDGGAVSNALVSLLVELEADAPAALAVDLVEQGLDQATQEALIAHLRRRKPDSRPLFLITRSCAILDLAAVGPDETIILCPANHSPPTYVVPYPGTPGYEAVATCLASPVVRARTEGVITWRPEVA